MLFYVCLFCEAGKIFSLFLSESLVVKLLSLYLDKQTEKAMTTAQAISNESYLKISNLSDSSDFNYAIERLKEIEATYGETKQSGLLMGRLMINRDKLIAAGK